MPEEKGTGSDVLLPGAARIGDGRRREVTKGTGLEGRHLAQRRMIEHLIISYPMYGVGMLAREEHDGFPPSLARSWMHRTIREPCCISSRGGGPWGKFCPATVSRSPGRGPRRPRGRPVRTPRPSGARQNRSAQSPSPRARTMRRIEQRTEQAPNRRGFLRATGLATGAGDSGGRASRCSAGTCAGPTTGLALASWHRRAGRSHIDIVNTLKAKGLAMPVAVCDVYRPGLMQPPASGGSTQSTWSTGPAGRPEGGRRVRRHARPPPRGADASTPSELARTSTARSR